MLLALPGNFGAAGGGAFSISQTDSVRPASVTAGQTQTYTGRSIGAAQADREIVVALMAQYGGSGGTDPPTCTIGGVTATKDAGGQKDGNQSTAVIFRAAVPSGTTANIVFSASSAGSSYSIVGFAVYRMVGRGAVGGAAALTGSDPSAEPLTLPTITPLSGGTSVFCFVGRGDSGTMSIANVTADIAWLSPTYGEVALVTTTSTPVVTGVTTFGSSQLYAMSASINYGP